MERRPVIAPASPAARPRPPRSPSMIGPVARAAADVARRARPRSRRASAPGCGRAAPWPASPCPACSSRTGSRWPRGTPAGSGAGPRAGVRPSSVVTRRPATSSTGSRQDSIGSPSTSTVQLPQPPWRQPSLTEVWPSWFRSTDWSVVMGATMTSTSRPDSSKLTMTEATLRLPSCRPARQLARAPVATNTPTIRRRYQSLAMASVNGSQSSAAAAAAAAAIAASSRRVPVIAASARVVRGSGAARRRRARSGLASRCPRPSSACDGDRHDRRRVRLPCGRT